MFDPRAMAVEETDEPIMDAVRHKADNLGRPLTEGEFAFLAREMTHGSHD